MKQRITIVIFIFFMTNISYGQKNKDVVMPMGNGIYIISKTGSSGFVNLRKLRREAIEIANDFAKKNNAAAEIVSINETPTARFVFPNVDLKFRLVENTKKLADSNNTMINLSSGYSSNGQLTDAQITISKPKQTSAEKFEKLEKLGKLYKDGFLTKEEFESEKKKILAEN